MAQGGFGLSGTVETPSEERQSGELARDAGSCAEGGWLGPAIHASAVCRGTVGHNSGGRLAVDRRLNGGDGQL